MTSPAFGGDYQEGTFAGSQRLTEVLLYLPENLPVLHLQTQLPHQTPGTVLECLSEVGHRNFPAAS